MHWEWIFILLTFISVSNLKYALEVDIVSSFFSSSGEIYCIVLLYGYAVCHYQSNKRIEIP